MNHNPNIIFLVLDTVGADHLSCYGYPKKTTPFLDQLAQEAVLYPNCYSPSCWTLPSHASIFTGTYLARHNMGDSGDILSENMDTMAAVLKRQGYDTLGICYIPWVSVLTGLNKGFDQFVDQIPRKSLGKVVRKLKRVGKGKKQTNGDGSPGLDLNDKAHSKYHWYKKLFFDDGAKTSNQYTMQWIKERERDKPFFAFINYCEAHSIYHPPLGYRNKFVSNRDKPYYQLNFDFKEFMFREPDMTENDFEILQGLYDGEINYLDSRIKNLYHFLQKENLLDNTILIITSDHGEQFGQKGFMGHVRNLYNSVIKVPLLIRFPNSFHDYLEPDRLVQTLDLFPTILEMTDVDDKAAWEQNQGNSLLKNGAQKRNPQTIISEYKYQPFTKDIYRRYPLEYLNKYNYSIRSMVWNKYKLIDKLNGKNDRNAEFYQIGEDVKENVDLAGNHDLLKTIKEELNNWLEHSNATNELLQPNEKHFKDQLTVQRLKALGYW